MARQRKMTPARKAFINSLLEHYQPNDAADVQEMLKDLLGDTLQGMLEAEMVQKLGYSKLPMSSIFSACLFLFFNIFILLFCPCCSNFCSIEQKPNI